MKDLGCYNDDQRQEIDDADRWTCPACSDLNHDQIAAREQRSTNELWRVTWKPTWEPEETKDLWPEFHTRLLEFEAREGEPDLSLPTADSDLSNLERQGFTNIDNSNEWKQKLDTELRNKVIFDLNPTNPQADIKPTGSCEFWLHEIDLVKYKDEQAPPDTDPHNQSLRPPPPLTLPEIYKAHMACIYNTQGKCVGMISPNRFHILYRAFYRAKLDGMHDKIKPAPASLASELQGLLSRKTLLENKYSSKKLTGPASRHPFSTPKVGLSHTRKNGLPFRPRPTLPILLEC